MPPLPQHNTFTAVLSTLGTPSGSMPPRTCVYDNWSEIYERALVRQRCCKRSQAHRLGSMASTPLEAGH